VRVARYDKTENSFARAFSAILPTPYNQGMKKPRNKHRPARHSAATKAKIATAHRLYQWDVWFKRSRFVLVRGHHYRVSQSSICNAARNEASRLGLSVSVEDLGRSIVVTVRGRKRRKLNV
jgi:hypothetical protein